LGENAVLIVEKSLEKMDKRLTIASA